MWTEIDLSKIKPADYLHPKGVDKVYNSCRNWRFAYQNVNQL